MSTKGGSVFADNPTFTDTPIHNQTFDRWVSRVRPGAARMILKAAIRDFVTTRPNRLHLKGEQAGSFAQEIADILRHADLWIQMPPIIGEMSALPGMCMNTVLIQPALTMQPPAKLFGDGFSDEIRLLTAFSLYAYVEQSNRKTFRSIDLYLSPTGIIAFLAKHGIAIDVS